MDDVDDPDDVMHTGYLDGHLDEGRTILYIMHVSGEDRSRVMAFFLVVLYLMTFRNDGPVMLIRKGALEIHPLFYSPNVKTQIAKKLSRIWKNRK